MIISDMTRSFAKMKLQLDPSTPIDIDNFLTLLAAKEVWNGHSSWVHNCYSLIFPDLPKLICCLVALNTSIK